MTDITDPTAGIGEAWERDEVRAKVDRLTADASERNAATVAPEENVAPEQQSNTQGILAGSLPNPTDVKPEVTAD